MHIKTLFAKFLSFFSPFYLRRKFTHLNLLVSIEAHARYVSKKAKACGKNIQIIKPLSIKNPQFFSIGDNFKLDYHGILEAWSSHNGCTFNPSVVIGNNVSFGKRCHIGCINRIEIGDNVLVGSDVLIIDHNHGKFDKNDLLIPPNSRLLNSKGDIKIGNNVWICDKVSVLPGVQIGNNCIIGANSVVTKDVPDNSLVCGAPAQVIKTIQGN